MVPCGCASIAGQMDRLAVMLVYDCSLNARRYLRRLLGKVDSGCPMCCHYERRRIRLQGILIEAKGSPHSTRDALSNAAARTLHHPRHNRTFKVLCVQANHDVRSLPLAYPHTAWALRKCSHMDQRTTTVRSPRRMLRPTCTRRAC